MDAAMDAAMNAPKPAKLPAASENASSPRSSSAARQPSKKPARTPQKGQPKSRLPRKHSHPPGHPEHYYHPAQTSPGGGGGGGSSSSRLKAADANTGAQYQTPLKKSDRKSSSRAGSAADDESESQYGHESPTSSSRFTPEKSYSTAAAEGLVDEDANSSGRISAGSDRPAKDAAAKENAPPAPPESGVERVDEQGPGDSKISLVTPGQARSLGLVHSENASVEHFESRIPVIPDEDENNSPTSSDTAIAAGEDFSVEPSHLIDDSSYPDLTEENDSTTPSGQAYFAGGVRWAPFNIPLKRRAQTLAVLLHCMGIAILVSLFFFVGAIPLTWPLLIPYLLHCLFSNAATDGRLRYRSERVRSSPWWKFFTGYFPAKLHKTHDLPPTRKYIFGYHPHGIISHGAWAAFATDALGFSKKFPGITNSLLTLDSNFHLPFYREYVFAMGLASVSKQSITNLLTRGGKNDEGMGRAVTIVVGGARESLAARPGQMRLIMRKGFIKLAIRTGADLVPVLAFGENDLYDQLDPESHPKVKRIQMFVLKVWKFTLPFLHGRGIFNYDVGMMPYRRPLNIVVGAPINVTMRASGNIDQAEIDALHDAYLAELKKMWNKYKDTFAKDRKEEMKISG